MARKIHKHKRHDDELEAPRNSLEMQVETSQSYNAMGDYLQCYQLEEDWSGKNYYPVEASMKKLINQEMSQSQPAETKQNAPSIVARLMGVDSFPVETKPAVQLRPIEKKNSKSGVKHFGKTETSSAAQLSSKSNDSRHSEHDYSVCSNNDIYADRLRNCQDQRFGISKPREHPQEEELQKFKKEFEAFQAKRLRECSDIIECGSIGRLKPLKEKLKTEKMRPFANSAEKMSDKSMERTGLHHNRQKMEYFQDERKQWISSRNRSMSADFEQPSMKDFDGKSDTAPTRIVILKPALDKFCSNDESWTSSSDTLERSGIENFLEEVKERLKLELQGKALKQSSGIRGSGIKTLCSEKPTDPKQIAKHLAGQVRENVGRDIGRKLLRSESTRSYRSENQYNGPDSPEYISRNSRRFLSDRLRNVREEETRSDIPVLSNGSMFENRKSVNERSCCEIVRDEEEMQIRSFRHGGDEGVVRREVSPRNLIRSLSAPVSGTSFGKLLLEDRHVVTGAQIRRKHEGIDNVSLGARKKTKERFNLKEKVSNIRYSFALRRRMFGKKIQTMVESQNTENDFLKDITSGPTVVMEFTERHENATEVPPSPASHCSSTQEEFWREVDHLSPVSTPDAASDEGNDVPFQEIDPPNLNELESDCIAERTTDIESELLDIEDQAEAYIRDLLVASGLYDGKSEKPLCISNTVFEQVEESYKKPSKENDNTANDHADHRMLLDLLNEALPSVLGPPMTTSIFKRKLLNSSTSQPPRRKKLLDSVWNIVRANLYPPADKSYYSLDSVVVRDLESTPWCVLMDEESNLLGVELANHILGSLVDEIARDLHR